MYYYSKNGYAIVKKHSVIFFLFILKFFLQLSVTGIIIYIGIVNKEVLGPEIINYVFFPLSFFLVNYSFLKFILSMIEYYNYLFIIEWDQIFIIKTSLVLQNDIEVIDAYKIIKLDVFSRWFFSNLLGYGKIIIELQTKEERIFHFMPSPYKLLEILKIQRENVLLNRKKKYLVDEYEGENEVNSNTNLS